jgi:hypothetical protein
MYAYQWWPDTTTGLLKLRNAANSAWVTVGTLADANLGLLSIAGGTLTGALLADDAGTAALPAIAFDGDPDTGAFRAGANEFGIATNGVERVEFGTSEVVFNDGGANYDFRIEGDTNANLFFVDASAEAVGIGVTGPQSPLHVNGTGDVAIQITNGTTGTGATDGSQITVEDPSMDLVLRNRENATIRFLTNNTERGRFDASGRLLVGTSTSTAVNDGEEPFVQVKGTDSRGGLSLARFSNDALSCGLYIGKSRGTSIGSNTIVASGDELGRITFSGSDGTDLHTQAASIKAEVDGTPGANDMPGRLIFSTTADGGSSPTERMRLVALVDY